MTRKSFKVFAVLLTHLFGLYPCLLGGADDLEVSRLGSYPEAPFVGGNRIAMAGHHAFVTDFSGIHAFEIGGATPFRWAGSLKTLYGANQIAVTGNFAVVKQGANLLVVDISDPANLKLTGVLHTSGFGALSANGSYAYLARHTFPEGGGEGSPGLIEVVDLRDPANPQVVARHPLPSLSAVSAGISAMASSGGLLGVAVTHWDAGEDGLTRIEVVDVQDPTHPKGVGFYETDGWLNADAMVMAGNRAYIAPWTIPTVGRLTKVEVIDLGDPAAPRELGAFSTSGEVYSLLTTGDQLYAARDLFNGTDYRPTIDILDVSDPAAPARVGGYTGAAGDYGPVFAMGSGVAVMLSQAGGRTRLTSFDVPTPTVLTQSGTLMPDGEVRDVALSGNRAFTVSTSGAFQVLDVSDPTHPERLGGSALNQFLYAVTTSGTHAYVAAHQGGIFVLDVTDPANPRRVATLRSGTSFQDVALADNLLAAADYFDGLRLFDATNPAKPVEVATPALRYGWDPYSKRVVLSGNRLFVASWEALSNTGGALEIFDVTTPSDPQWVGAYDLAGRPRGLAVLGNLAVVSYLEGSLDILDVSEAGNPRRLASYAVESYNAPGDWGAAQLEGHRAFVYCAGFNAPDGEYSSSILVIDLSQPDRPRRIGAVDLSAYAIGLAVSGNNVFTTGSTGMQIARLDLARVKLANAFEVGASAVGVAVKGSTAYLAAGEAGIKVVDISNPLQPLLLGSFATPAPANDVVVDGNTLLVAAGEAGLILVDVTNPSNPQALGTLDTTGQAKSVLLAGTTAFVADGSEGVQVVDISNPAQPKRMGGLGSDDRAFGLAWYDNQLLVASGEAGLDVVDVSDPTQPQRIGKWNRAGRVKAVAVSGSHALVSDGLNGFVVLDLSDATNPREVGRAGAGVAAYDIAVAGSFAYVAEGFTGVRVFDLSDPTQPRPVGGNTALAAYRLAVTDNRLLAAAGESGLGQFELLQPPAELRTSHSGNTLELAWPASATGFGLESSDTLNATPNWQPEPTAPLRVGDQNVVTLELEAGPKFYRLKKL